MYGSQAIVIGLLVVYFIFTLGGFAMAHLYINSYAPGFLHGYLCLSGTIVSGYGICLYRLFRGSRTSVIKYIHAIIQCISAALIITGVSFARSGKLIANNNHDHPGYVLCVLLIIQITCAYAFYLLGATPKARYNFSPIHDICGVLMFALMVANNYVGTRNIYQITKEDDEIEDINPVNDPDAAILFFKVSGFVGYIMPIAIVLCPFLEWEIVGKL